MLRSKIKGAVCSVLAASVFLCCSGCGEKVPEAAPSVPEQLSLTPAPVFAEVPLPQNGDGEFSIRYREDEPINPYKLKSQTNRLVSSLVYEGLFAVSPGFESENVLCESFSSQNGTDYTINILQGVRFHNGDELTADDVVYSLRLARKSDFYSSRLALIDSISASDRYTVDITLSKPNTFLPLLLDVPIIRSDTGDNSNPVGTGPYSLSYSGGKPSLQSFRMWRNSAAITCRSIGLVDCVDEELSSAYETGEIDLVFSDPTGISYINFGGNNETWYYDTTSMQYIGFNTNHLFLGNSWARRAVSMTIDRAGIAENCMAGCAAVSTLPVNPASPLWNSEIDAQNGYSLQTMSELLLEHETSDTDGDGYFEYNVNGIDVSFKISFIVNVENRNRLDAARRITAALRNAGFDITLRELSWDDYVRALQAGNFDMYYGEVMLTPDFDLSPLLKVGGELNYGGASNSECSELIDKYLSANEVHQKSAATELYKFLADYCPIAPILFRREAVLTHRGAVSDAAPTQYNAFHGIADWHIKTE